MKFSQDKTKFQHNQLISELVLDAREEYRPGKRLLKILTDDYEARLDPDIVPLLNALVDKDFSTAMSCSSGFVFLEHPSHRALEVLKIMGKNLSNASIDIDCVEGHKRIALHFSAKSRQELLEGAQQVKNANLRSSWSDIPEAKWLDNIQERIGREIFNARRCIWGKPNHEAIYIEDIGINEISYGYVCVRPGQDGDLLRPIEDVVQFLSGNKPWHPTLKTVKVSAEDKKNSQKWVEARTDDGVIFSFSLKDQNPEICAHKVLSTLAQLKATEVPWEAIDLKNLNYREIEKVLLRRAEKAKDPLTVRRIIETTRQIRKEIPEADFIVVPALRVLQEAKDDNLLERNLGPNFQEALRLAKKELLFGPITEADGCTPGEWKKGPEGYEKALIRQKGHKGWLIRHSGEKRPFGVQWAKQDLEEKGLT